MVKDFDIEPMNFGRLGMIIVRGFDNQAELDHYRAVMAASPDFRLPAGVRPIAISAANLQLLFDEGRSFEEYFQYLEEQNYVDAQAGLLVPEAIETLPEAAAAAEEAADDVNAGRFRRQRKRRRQRSRGAIHCARPAVGNSRRRRANPRRHRPKKSPQSSRQNPQRPPLPRLRPPTTPAPSRQRRRLPRPPPNPRRLLSNPAPKATPLLEE